MGGNGGALRSETEASRADEHFTRAVASYLGHRRDLGRLLEATLAAAPDHIGAHCLAGFAQLLLGRAELIPLAWVSLAAARDARARHGGTPAERDMIEALAPWCAGEMEESAARLDAMLRRAPGDALIAKLAHALCFMLGDAAGMRRSIESILPRWQPGDARYGFMLGLHAFALEETGDLAAAERAAREALAHQPDDVWAAHALAHVFEMRGEPRRGIAFLGETAQRWPALNNFGRHLAWHRALFHLATGDVAMALALYDGEIREQLTDDYRDIANAVALLLRLEARGAAVASRWRELADLAEARSGDHALVFAQLHYLIALVRDGRSEAARRFIAAMEAASRRRSGSQARVLDAIGVPLARRIIAPAAPLPPTATRAAVARLGGSAVQRQIFERFFDEARPAARTGHAVCQVS